MRTLLFLLLSLVAATAGQQTLFWDLSTSPGVLYEFRFATNSGGAVQFTRTSGIGTSSNTFTLPAGRWYVRGVALTSSNGVSDLSNEAVFDIPAPITIRLNLSSASSPEGPWKDETNSPPMVVAATNPQRFYRARVEISSP